MPWRQGLGGLLLIAILLTVYGPALRGGLVWDDEAHVTAAELRSSEGLRRIWFELDATQQYYPVLHTAFWIEHRLWGDSVFGYHLMNVLQHGVAALLVVAITHRLLAGGSKSPAPPGERCPRGEENPESREGRRVAATDARRGEQHEHGRQVRPSVAVPAAWLAGVVFAVHPLHVESVAWISEQKNTLSAVFYLSAALLYLRFAGAADRGRSGALAAYGGATALFVLALLTKSVTATLPAALLVVVWWQRGRLSVKRDVGPLVPWLLLGIAAGLFTAWFERTYIGAAGQEFALGAVERVLLASRALLFYVGKVVWPVNLMFNYPRWTIDAAAAWQYLFPVIAVILLLALGVIARRNRGPLAGALFFAGTLFPALGFVAVFPFMYSYVADHFAYLASLGLIVPCAAGLVAFGAGLPSGFRRTIMVTGALVLGLLATLTWRQSGTYRDAETLYRETLARNPESSLAHNNLGEILAARPDGQSEAMAHYEAAVRANPRNAPARNNLALALAKQPGRLAEAMVHYETAIQLQPRLFEPRNNLGVLLAGMPERRDEGIAHLQEAARLNPNSAEVHDNLGVALMGANRLPEAIAELTIAVQLRPDSAQWRSHLGVALASVAGQEARALAEFEAAVRLAPTFVEARHNLGRLLVTVPSRAAEGIAHLEAAVRSDPGRPELRASLGQALLSAPGRLAEAVECLEMAVQARPDMAEWQQNLGVGLLRLDRPREASAAFTTALQHAPEMVEAHYGLAVTLSADPARHAEARQHLEALLRLQPDFAAARQLLDELRGDR